ncbi:PKD domain-containing protein [Aquimarina sp. BL5]|uniref:PKD domain-containing protein n=1 Tax=Aquimarina sp. BL5 TaxID=1714860 RepID=UPI000E4E73F4|nr:PKD domain-containing protein [Aquimarina sp. BL5]AXT53817.1 PKD domain-containing protein [Aquimarina sp. BL5]RKM90935.1 PKD domain-containing protein [Aquimarina sp. BL5]
MKKSSSTTNYHMDKSVVLFFIITILVTATVFAFKYVNYTPCEIIELSYSKTEAKVDESIEFEDKTIGALEWKWDFGDSTATDTRRKLFHTYKKPGEYTISLIVNGKCPKIQTITVLEKEEVLDPLKKAKFKILTPKIRVGEKLKVKDNTLNATSWEWNFEDAIGANSKEQNPEYVYNTEGKKTITLIPNGELKYATKQTIEVLPKIIEVVRRDETVVREISTIPVDPIGEGSIDVDPKEEFKAPFINEKSFKAKLILVSTKKASVNDFKDYLCGNLDLPIIVNRKRTTFIEFCEKIKGKGIKIKELELTREDNNCIKNIVLKYSKTSIF